MQEPRARINETVAISKGQGEGMVTSSLKERDHIGKASLRAVMTCS